MCGGPDLVLGRQISGYLVKGIENSMAQGRSTKTISMIKWIRTSRLSIKNSLPDLVLQLARLDLVLNPVP